jgi:putative spermidine/putrescine transport system substrate-binding protein
VTNFAISRRNALKTVAAAGATAVFSPFVISANAQEKRIVCRDAGVGTSFQDAWAGPFKKATGIEVVPVISQTEPIGLIRQMVETKTYTWDMASGLQDGPVYQLALDSGSCEPLNISSDGSWGEINDDFKTDHFVATNVVASIMGYSSKVKEPTSWADFFNTSGFKGIRGLRKNPQEVIEFALLADGVDIKDLYPCDIDRAFKALDRIKKDIGVWWTSGAQTAQLLQSGEVDYINSWNSRVQPLIDGGLPVKIMWNQSLWGGSGFIILKGTPKADICREFIKFCIQPEQQAAYANATGLGYTHPDALKFIKPEVALKLPTHPDHAKSVAVIDYRFWLKARDPAIDRFNQWLLG